MPTQNSHKTVDLSGPMGVETAFQAHEGKLYYRKFQTNRERILSENQKLRGEFSGLGKGMDFILQIPEIDYQEALLKYNFRTGSMEDRRRECERAARDHPEWVAYSKNPRRFARRK